MTSNKRHRDDLGGFQSTFPTKLIHQFSWTLFGFPVERQLLSLQRQPEAHLWWEAPIWFASDFLGVNRWVQAEIKNAERKLNQKDEYYLREQIPSTEVSRIVLHERTLSATVGSFHASWGCIKDAFGRPVQLLSDRQKRN